jgi:hypothetical protein
MVYMYFQNLQSIKCPELEKDGIAPEVLKFVKLSFRSRYFQNLIFAPPPNLLSSLI